jgi:hypothetical protein
MRIHGRIALEITQQLVSHEIVAQPEKFWPGGLGIAAELVRTIRWPLVFTSEEKVPVPEVIALKR